MKRFAHGMLAVLLLLSAPALAQKAEDEAGDVSEADKDSAGPLRDRIPPVSGHLFLMDGRFEVSPGIGLSVRDAFFTKVMFGAALTYHFTETVGVSVRGGYNLSLVSGAAQICTAGNATTRASCRPPTVEELTTRVDANGARVPANVAYGLNTLLASVDLQWAPIYGKLSLSSEKVLSFNMYGLIGPTLVMYGPLNTLTAGGNVGLGFRFFLNKFLTVRVELRDTVYYEEGVGGSAGAGSVRNQLMAEFGFSIFLPTVFQER
ncbi:MAG: outer membrane beta-barrel domain-containing protein [Myxococcaceae bacterium]|jgi:outer membrane beta-barrel protein|nr:outer membrane beta-barrel domain-containing protein [Myxococcaceae bacterium]